eukprot:TRINITY_DN3828_c0_g1_i1.p1 TRINITY_DN3828_c0_g1~~TRINITY_DN3828_c0_g1_i1.p1  ORF type:complete len:946 (+),score=242.96 TRINITY_DN3828_c0_g1_i1:77-2914(+)
MADVGGGLADSKSKEFEQLAKVVHQIDGEVLLTGVSALQTIKRTGKSALKKSRVLAVTKSLCGKHFNLYLLKKENNSVKEKCRLKIGTLLAEKDHELTLHLEDEVLVLSLRTGKERDYFLATCDRYLRENRRSMPVSSFQNLDIPSPDTPVKKQSTVVEEKKGLLTQADDDALALILTKYEKTGNNDARQLRDHVNGIIAQLQTENAATIVQGEKEWSGLVDKFETMAWELSNVQARLVQFTNNLEKKSEKIGIVERERATRETVHTNYDKLVSELEGLQDQLEPATHFIQTLHNSGFGPLERTRIIEAMNWAKTFDKKNLEGTYSVAAVRSTIAQVDSAKHKMADRLVEYLEEDFKVMGTRLKAQSMKKKKLSAGNLKWRSHQQHHNTWLQLRPLMPSVLNKGVTVVMKLCRTYAGQMKPSYRQEIHGYFKELRAKLLRKKHKSVFYLGADVKELKGLELLAELNQGSYGSSYAASEAPTMMSVARSGVSAASEEFEEEPSILNELGICVYRGSGSGNITAGASEPYSSRRSSRNGSISMGSDGVSAQSTTITDKDGKERIPPYTALIQSIICCTEVVLAEQEFLERMFGLTQDPGSDGDMVTMVTHMFRDDGLKKHLIAHELMESVAYIKHECDMMALIPVSLVVSQLQDAMSSRSTVLSDVLQSVGGGVKDALFEWQEQQLKTVDKYKTDIKHCTVLPCFIRFKLFIKRLESMCAPIPLTAPFEIVQNIIDVVCKSMFNRLAYLCETDSKYKDFFYIKNLSYFLEFMKDARMVPSGLTEKLLSKQFERTEQLERTRKDKERQYIVNTLLQDVFATLFEFIDAAEKCLEANSQKVEELNMHQRFSHSSVEALLSQTRLKTVQSQIHVVYKRQNKHFFEHTTSRDQFINLLFHNTWEATKAYILDNWARLQSLLHKCYPQLLKAYSCDVTRITSILDQQNLGGT